MRGATRMYDPSEAVHDRVRRRAMNIAFAVIALLNAAQLRAVGVHGWDWLRVTLLAVAAMPLAMGVRIFELRFKMAREERARMLRELPARKQTEFLVHALLLLILFALDAPYLTWALVGIWLYDFVKYYHDRPERMRHVYAVAKTLDELRRFSVPWVWPLPALAFEIVRRVL